MPKYRFDYHGYDTNKLKMIGRGHEGKVYLLPNDRVIKVFHNPSSCARQVAILLNAQNSRFFPTVFDYDSHSIIMSFVYGSTLSVYLKHNTITKHLSLELVQLIIEFKKLHFTRLDMRLGHIFLQPDERIKAIDPRGSYEKKRPYPRSMLKGLRKAGELENFLNYIRYDYPDYYHYWIKMLSKEQH